MNINLNHSFTKLEGGQLNFNGSVPTQVALAP